MKPLRFFITALICLFAFAAHAEAEDDPIANAVFASDVTTPNVYTPKQGVGIIFPSIKGIGVVYTRSLRARTTAWARLTYEGREHYFLEDYEATPQVGRAEIELEKRYQFMMGVDQLFHLTNNRRWGVVLGGGAGFSQSQYDVSYYRGLCSFFCGFDPNNPLKENKTDIYGFLFGTFGVKLLETQVYNLRGDLKISFSPMLARTGSFEFRGPDGHTYEPIDLAPLDIEATITF